MATDEQPTCPRCKYLARLLERAWAVMFLPADGVLKFDVDAEFLDLRNAMADVLVMSGKRGA